jgi:hypothetical protein
MNVRTATLNTLGTSLRVAGLAGSLLGSAAAIDEVSLEAVAAIVVGVALVRRRASGELRRADSVVRLVEVAAGTGMFVPHECRPARVEE